MEITSIERITADLDKGFFPIEMKVIWCRLIFYLYGFRNIEVRVSPSGKGRHVIGWHKGRGYSREKILKIRKLSFDDKIRVYLDGSDKGKRQVNVLFNKKQKEQTDKLPFGIKFK